MICRMLESVGTTNDLSEPKPLALFFRNALSRCSRPALRSCGRSRMASLLQCLLHPWRPVSNSRASPRANARQSRTCHGLWPQDARHSSMQHVLLSKPWPPRSCARHFRASRAS